jgi:hypothetical protein
MGLPGLTAYKVTPLATIFTRNILYSADTATVCIKLLAKKSLK